MEHFTRLWKSSSPLGKIAVGCGAFIALTFLCGICSGIAGFLTNFESTSTEAQAVSEQALSEEEEQPATVAEAQVQRPTEKPQPTTVIPTTTLTPSPIPTSTPTIARTGTARVKGTLFAYETRVNLQSN